MRSFAFTLVLFAVGCHGPQSCSPGAPSTCESTAERLGPPTRCAPQPPEKIAAPCPPPSRVECQTPETIRVKAPAPQVIIEAPPPTRISQAALAPAPQATYAAPQATYGAPQSITSVQQVPVGRSRLGFTFEFIRIPFPMIRPIAVPTTPEVTMAVAPPQLVTAAPQLVTAAPQMVAVQQAVAPQAVAPQAVVAAPQQVAAPVQAQALVPVQGQAIVPVQGQAIVPVQGQAVVPVQSEAVFAGQGFTQATVNPAQAFPSAVFSPQGVVAPQQATRSPTPEEADEFCRQWSAYKAKMQRAQGQPPGADKK